MGPMMLPGQGAHEERWEVPASRKAQGKERTMQASPTPQRWTRRWRSTSRSKRRRRSRRRGGRMLPPWWWCGRLLVP